MKLSTQHHQPITLAAEIGKGGEATVYHVTEYPDMVAKIYHQPTPAHEAKLRAMILNPPQSSSPQTALAWPIELLYKPAKGLRTPDADSAIPLRSSDADSALIQGEFVGFLMPKITGYEPVFKAYNPVLREPTFPQFTWRALHRIAANLVSMMATLHAKGYVIGDMNESNVLVNEQALVMLIDCDSFQVRAEELYHCEVGKAEYTPPELQGVNFKTVEQTIEHDLFRLAVLIFQLVMNGHHPFAGVLTSPESVGRVDIYHLRLGIFPYTESTRSQPPPHAPDFELLHPWLQAAFTRGFVQGHHDPSFRITASEWRDILAKATEELVTCEANARHVYSQHVTPCPYCQPRLRATSDGLTELVKAFSEGLWGYEQQEPSQVIQAMSRVIRLGSPPVEAYSYRAWAYLQQRNQAEAKRDAQLAIAINRHDPIPHYVLGIAHLREGQPALAIPELTLAIKYNYYPLSPVYEARQKAYQLTGNHLAAQVDQSKLYLLAQGQSVLDMLHHPTKPRQVGYNTLYQYGLQAYQMNKPVATLLVMTVLIHQGWQKGEVYAYRSWAHYQLGDYQAALEDYRRAVPLFPLNLPQPNVVVLMLQHLKQAYQAREAATVQQLCLALAPLYNGPSQGANHFFDPQVTQWAKIQAYLAWAYYEQGQLDLAEQKCRQLVAKEMDIPLIYALYGQILLRKGEARQAINRFTQAIRQKYQLKECYYGRAQAYHHQGFLKHALADLQQYLTLESDPAQIEAAQALHAAWTDKLAEPATWRKLLQRGGGRVS